MKNATGALAVHDFNVDAKRRAVLFRFGIRLKNIFGAHSLKKKPFVRFMILEIKQIDPIIGVEIEFLTILLSIDGKFPYY